MNKNTKLWIIAGITVASAIVVAIIVTVIVLLLSNNNNNPTTAPNAAAVSALCGGASNEMPLYLIESITNPSGDQNLFLTNDPNIDTSLYKMLNNGQPTITLCYPTIAPTSNMVPIYEYNNPTYPWYTVFGTNSSLPPNTTNSSIPLTTVDFSGKPLGYAFNAPNVDNIQLKPLYYLSVVFTNGASNGILSHSLTEQYGNFFYSNAQFLGYSP